MKLILIELYGLYTGLVIAVFSNQKLDNVEV